uniref:uncharacterized protein LOC122601595 n=1 Tax=Erigeron canadensis TaxID=72917 RepID=UPI001CB94309|nr:uncharacterized protein LOC122601595 [Erigeron canadensis]
MTLKPTPPSTTISLASSKIMPNETPIKIGTKGTVGSLMMKELEYFNKLEVHSQQHTLHVREAAASSQPRSKMINSVTITPKRKKKSKNFVPSICSAIDVADTNGPKMISAFSYKTLKADARRLQV